METEISLPLAHIQEPRIQAFIHPWKGKIMAFPLRASKIPGIIPLLALFALGTPGHAQVAVNLEFGPSSATDYTNRAYVNYGWSSSTGTPWESIGAPGAAGLKSYPVYVSPDQSVYKSCFEVTTSAASPAAPNTRMWLHNFPFQISSSFPPRWESISSGTTNFVRIWASSTDAGILPVYITASSATYNNRDFYVTVTWVKPLDNTQTAATCMIPGKPFIDQNASSEDGYYFTSWTN
jgi:hypothetical protein